MRAKRISMWSGPRNLSTALMRSFASRTDCSVIDEPFYAAYLETTGIDHPMKNLILKTYNVDPKVIAERCAFGEVTTKIQYQKQMTHHMLDTFDRSFIHEVSNGFLIRAPEKVVKSFGEKITDFSLNDLGYKQQVELFNMVCDRNGSPPPVIDADDLCAYPKVILLNLCIKLGIDFSGKMLSWNIGPHPYDGVWGSYWYKAVNKSSGFKIPKPVLGKPSCIQKRLIEEADPYFQYLNKYKIFP